MRIFLLISVLMSVSYHCCSQRLKQQKLNELVKNHSDSINNIFKYKIVPTFLEDSCFDYNPFYWPSIHRPISLRTLILKKVNNLKALDSLITLNNILFKSKCSLDYEILDIMPNINQSFYDLLLIRRDELNHIIKTPDKSKNKKGAYKND